MAHCLALVITTLCLSPLTQSDDFSFYQEIASIAPLQSKAVQQELKVTDAQRTSLNKHADWYNVEAQDLVAKTKKGELTTDEFNKRVAAAQIEMQHRALAELTKGQVTRLGQITLQLKGIPALLTIAVSTKLGLTEAQKKLLATGWNDTGKAVAETERKAKEPILKKYGAMSPKSDEEKTKLEVEMKEEISAASEAIKPELLRLKKSFEDIVDKTLTAGQKKSWSDLKGPAFKPS